MDNGPQIKRSRQRQPGDTTGTVHDLHAWQEAMVLVREVYGLCKQLPKNEAFGLVSQMQRAAISVPSNIAEGYGRGTKQEFQHFLYVARGSLAELETQLLLAAELYPPIQTSNLASRAVQVQRMLTALIPKIVKPR